MHEPTLLGSMKSDNNVPSSPKSFRIEKIVPSWSRSSSSVSEVLASPKTPMKSRISDGFELSVMFSNTA